MRYYFFYCFVLYHSFLYGSSSTTNCHDVSSEILNKFNVPFSLSENGEIKIDNKVGYTKYNYNKETGLHLFECDSGCTFSKIEIEDNSLNKIKSNTVSKIIAKRKNGDWVSFKFFYREKSCYLEQISNDGGVVFDLDFCREWKNFKEANKTIIKSCGDVLKNQNKELCKKMSEYESSSKDKIQFQLKPETCNESIGDQLFTKRFEHNCRFFNSSDLPMRMVDSNIESSSDVTRREEAAKAREAEISERESQERDEKNKEANQKEIDSECGKKDSEGFKVAPKAWDSYYFEPYIVCRNGIGRSESLHAKKVCGGDPGYYDVKSKSIVCEHPQYVAPAPNGILNMVLPPSPIGVGGIYMKGAL